MKQSDYNLNDEMEHIPSSSEPMEPFFLRETIQEKIEGSCGSSFNLPLFVTTTEQSQGIREIVDRFLESRRHSELQGTNS